MSEFSFPDGFLWGAATSAYQIEGAAHHDGRGESIWDRFARTPGRVADGSNGDHACDHYNRWQDDLSLMQRLGLRAYRFSIAWPRILPAGRGARNQRGLDFYDRLVDGLLAAGIEPVATLYHWDLPQALEDEGGWPARSTAEAFIAYADVVSERLGDRVKKWITHNEPWCIAMLGHHKGIHAPGRTDFSAALAAAHHVLLSHGWAVEVLRANSPGAQVGITLNLVPSMPASPSDADRDACRHFDGQFNRWYLDPLYGRDYPIDLLEAYAAAGHTLPPAQTGDLETIAAPTDFLGVNYYSRGVIRSDKIAEADNQPRTETIAPPSEWTDMGWEVYPDGLETLLKRVHRDYAPRTIYVTENGASYDTRPRDDGRIPDDARVRYLREHFLAARRALDAGVPLGGYFVWSLLDNFEWDRGYQQRFGITWVDYQTQERIPKDSALWFRQVIAANAVVDIDTY